MSTPKKEKLLAHIIRRTWIGMVALVAIIAIVGSIVFTLFGIGYSLYNYPLARTIGYISFALLFCYAIGRSIVEAEEQAEIDEKYYSRDNNGDAEADQTASLQES